MERAAPYSYRERREKERWQLKAVAKPEAEPKALPKRKPLQDPRYGAGGGTPAEAKSSEYIR